MKKLVMFLLAFCILAGVAFAQNDTNGINQISARENWLVESNTTSHSVTLIDVTDKGDACGFNVDGYVTWINVKEDKWINGVYIKVFEAYPVHSQLQNNDACKVFIGGGTLVKAYSSPANASANITENKTVVIENKTPENITANNVTANMTAPQKEENLTIWQIIIRFLAGLFGRNV